MATELELDQSENPTALVAGDPATIAATAAHMNKLGGAFERTAGGLRRIDLGEWTGEAADAFRASFKESPKGWADAADAFGRAGRVLDGYRSTVAWAQDQAGQAIALYRQGVNASVRARADYNRQVDEHNATAAPAPLPPFTDPGQAAMEQARQLLAAARRGRDSAAEQTARALTDAAALAPPLPSGWDQLGADLLDGAKANLTEFGHMVEGIGEGVEGLVKLFRAVNPRDPYNITHPAQYLDNLSTMTAGLLHTAAHPVEMIKDVTGTGWGSDPSKAAGRLIPNILLGIATGGAGTAAKVTGGVTRRGTQTATRQAETHPASPLPHSSAGRFPPPLQRDVPLPLNKPLLKRYVGEDDPNNPKRFFYPQTVKYMTPEELEDRRLFAQDGKLFNASDGTPFDTRAGGTHWAGDGHAIFVMDENGNLYASLEHEVGELHHSSFLSGRPVAGAGELTVDNGTITNISRNSGHYQPPETLHDQVRQALSEQGIHLDDRVFDRGRF